MSDGPKNDVDPRRDDARKVWEPPHITSSALRDTSKPVVPPEDDASGFS